jgi:MinD-like ATPase involved in chromosome partitioning or flagellar assembly
MSDILEDFLEAKLQDEFIRTDEEWVNIYITPLNRIDLTIVSNIADEMDKSELRGYIRNLVFEYLGVDEGSRYSIGFLDTYNTDEADDLLLQKPEYRRKQPITWSEVVSMNNYIRSKISSRNYSVICFYSYKGGVGRTTALLQVAYTLAAQGKNIVLIDFDIEAPSFHLLFKKWIDDPKYGIKYGLVDYLYERMASVDPEEYKIKITDVFTTIKVNETLNGNIYVVPATVKLTNQYIFKLAQLHSNIIFENEYVEEFIDALASRLKFNTVFIDTRTGINQWGAFPLLGFADQIVLVAYPNEENVEGLTNINSLITSK